MMNLLDKSVFVFLFVFLLLAGQGFAVEYHVAKTGSDQAAGTKSQPFNTISRAAAVAKPGDVITVHAGIYRELVVPARGGRSDSQRIVYRAAKGEKVEIRGSEVIRGWKQIAAGIWEVTLPDTFFEAYNPYQDLIYGDWFFPGKRKLHTGEVYLNGRALYETASLERLLSGSAEAAPVGVSPLKALAPSFTWFARSAEGNTIITANFHEHDPSRELVEINVRPSCFYPAKTGVNYITVSGFIMSQAATQWAAPTAEQVGLIGTNWSKGWIIENNTISDSKCVGITLGKDRASGHNVWSADMQKDGSLHYNEMVERVIAGGWNKENIGSHQVRKNTIFNCGAAGICGSFGAAFSQITGNHIYDIYTRRNYYGAEMGGIKIHGAIDVLVKGNRLRNTFIGLWLDWMAQGTRVSANAFVDNDYVDFFPEVNHGPYLVDHNLFLSDHSLKDWSEGGAYAHNLFAGLLSRAPQDRHTPIFQPHSTRWVRIAQIDGGDNQFYNNVFTSNNTHPQAQPKMHAMDSPDSLSGYGLVIYDRAAQPVVANGNTYSGLARPGKQEGQIERIKGFEIARLIDDARENSPIGRRVNVSSLKKRPVLSTGKFRPVLKAKQGFNDSKGRALLLNMDFFGDLATPANNISGPFLKR